MKGVSFFKYDGSIEKYSTFLFYIFINALFVVKYGGNLNILLTIGYIITIVIFGNFYLKINLNNTIYKFLFWILLLVFFIFSIGVNYFVDGYSLNVDRWDAMEVGIKAMLNGEYPYNIKDYLGRESSNLPSLIILGFPFYILFGSVGYLQSFVFLLFSYLIFKIFKVYKERLAVLLLLVLSPSYLWEIYTKSDLFSNFVITLGFVFIVWRYFVEQKKIKIEWVAVLTAFIILTRLSVIIPLIILLFRTFCKFSVKEKMRFSTVFVLSTIAILFLFFHNASDLDMILRHNPFVIQGGKQPLLLSILYIILALVLSFKVESLKKMTYTIGSLLFICVIVSFISSLFIYGYHNVIEESNFDISFFNMSMPFIIICLGFNFFSLFKSHVK